MGFLDRLKNMTPLDEMVGAGMSAARGIGNVAGQGAYGFGRAAGTGVGALGRVAGQGVDLYGQALGRMAGMGMDAAQGIGRYGMQGGQALGSAGLDGLRSQMNMARTIGSGLGGAAMGAGRGFMDGVQGPQGAARGMPNMGSMMDNVMAARRRQLQNQQGPMIMVRQPGGNSNTQLPSSYYQY
jgi:hypothetical protein